LGPIESRGKGRKTQGGADWHASCFGCVMTTQMAVLDTNLASAQDPPKPEWISLNQALRFLAGRWTPIPECEYRAIESLPPPDDPEIRSMLVLALARGQIRHQGELWRKRRIPVYSGNVMDSSRGFTQLPEEQPMHRFQLVANEYRVVPSLWLAKHVFFGSSELDIPKGSVNVGCDDPSNHRPTGFYRLRHIVVSLADVEKLPRHIEKTKSGGRPPKKEGLIKICAYTSAHIHHRGLPVKQALLVDAVLGYAETELPEHERLARTNVAAIVRAHLKAIEVFKQKK
jgi:hypothetical protein